MTNIQPPCEALIDQNRFIGEDPVGGRCCNSGTHYTKEGAWICDDCQTLIEMEPHRVLIHFYPFTAHIKLKMAMETFHKMLEQVPETQMPETIKIQRVGQ